MSEFVSFLNDLRRYKIITKRQVFLAWLKSPQIRFLIVFRKAVEYKKYSLMGFFSEYYIGIILYKPAIRFR